MDGLELSTLTLPVYWRNRAFLPSIDLIADEIRRGIINTVPRCVDAVQETFPDKYLIANVGKPAAEVMITDPDVIIMLSYPISIKSQGKEERISSFDIRIRSHLQKFLSIASKIVDKYDTMPGYLCLSCLDDLADNLTRITTTPYLSDEGSYYYLISIQDLSTTYNNSLRFAIAIPEEVGNI
ncbi:MAG: hypothetical protein AABX52_04600 [Nanoarchaeota archaeon]